ncbi:Curlin genes transcriptional activatory protein [Pragia fontium]|uniref:Sigma factor-binding protein Crl n=1 Tax=Pragia fontium DSM 5563 = ATCC 49100 TaxID=1122977 RepID=A0AAJ5BH97_9GAMM|nr:sigma factor-binding protein Crl [Pragia fontium]SFC87185.1 sigma factor-binding protein Crl [Pragia fontium DSM 5563 = ATCC 49100]SUB83185.1 Curlin genes transcriptional activatory protein [Pragia fontium]
MLLPNGHPRSRLLKEFVSLGPYIRESQCKGNHYFFDCLTVCVSSKPSPEKREFWGWWMDIEADEQGFTYRTQIGLYDKAGDWQVKPIKDADVQKEIDENLKEFQQKLERYLTSIKLTFRPMVSAAAKDKSPA